MDNIDEGNGPSESGDPKATTPDAAVLASVASGPVDSGSAVGTSSGVPVGTPPALDAPSPDTSYPSTPPSGRRRRKNSSRPVNYSLRPAKNIERKMMVEALSRIGTVAPLSSYRYVGMGSEFFNDFSLFHQYLGIKSMVSIERDLHRISRCNFNKPYQCIEVKHGKSSEVLPVLQWQERNVVWLDYTGRLESSSLSDLEFLVSQVVSGSVVIWSVNADPWDECDDETQSQISHSELPRHRLKMLKRDVGEKRVRAELKGNTLAQWGLAKEYHRIILQEIERTLNDRNASGVTARG